MTMVPWFSVTMTMVHLSLYVQRMTSPLSQIVLKRVKVKTKEAGNDPNLRLADANTKSEIR